MPLAYVQKAVKYLLLIISVMLVPHIRAVVPPTGEVEQQSMLGDFQLRKEDQSRERTFQRSLCFLQLALIVLAEASVHPC